MSSLAGAASEGGDRFQGICMIRIFLIVLAAGVAALAAGFIYLGAVPPKPHVQEVHVVLPNDRFGSD